MSHSADDHWEQQQKKMLEYARTHHEEATQAFLEIQRHERRNPTPEFLEKATAMLKKTDHQFRMMSDFLKSIDQFGHAREFMLQREKDAGKAKK